jgi:hypothetical protein
MREIGVGIVGGGYMGKAHAVAMSAVGAVFDTACGPALRWSPRSSPNRRNATAPPLASRARRRLARTGGRPRGRGVIIASPQTTHRAIAEAAFALGSRCSVKNRWAPRWTTAAPWSPRAEASGLPTWSASTISARPPRNSPASCWPRAPSATSPGSAASIPKISTPIPKRPANWRTTGMANGTMGDLAPHMINCALALMGPITELSDGRDRNRPCHAPEWRFPVDNDDHAQMMCASPRRDGPSLFQPHRDGPQDGLCLRDPWHQGRDPLRPGRPERALALPRRGAGGDARVHERS